MEMENLIDCVENFTEMIIRYERIETRNEIPILL